MNGRTFGVALFTLVIAVLGHLDNLQDLPEHLKVHIGDPNPQGSASYHPYHLELEPINEGPNHEDQREGRAYRNPGRDHPDQRQSDRAARRKPAPEADYPANSLQDDEYYYYEDEYDRDFQVEPQRQGQPHPAGQPPPPPVVLPVQPKAQSAPLRAPIPPRSQVQSYPVVESGYQDNHYSPQTKSKLPKLPAFLKSILTCLPLSLLAAAIPLGFANLNPVVSTVTLNPAPVTLTSTVTITVADPGDGGGGDGSGDGSGSGSVSGGGGTGGSGEDVILILRNGINVTLDALIDEDMVRLADTTKVSPPEKLEENEAIPSAALPRMEDGHSSLPFGMIGDEIVPMTTRLKNEQYIAERLSELAQILDGVQPENQLLTQLEGETEENSNEVVTVPFEQEDPEAWTFHEPMDNPEPNIFVTKMSNGTYPVEIVRLRGNPALGNRNVTSHEIVHLDLSELGMKDDPIVSDSNLNENDSNPMNAHVSYSNGGIHNETQVSITQTKKTSSQSTSNSSTQTKSQSRVPRLDFKNWH